MVRKRLVLQDVCFWCRFTVLLHYLPVKRHLHYLAPGFGLTAMLTVLYSNVQRCWCCNFCYAWNRCVYQNFKRTNGCLHKQLQICIYDRGCHHRYLPCSATLRQPTYSCSCSSEQCRSGKLKMTNLITTNSLKRILNKSTNMYTFN